MQNLKQNLKLTEKWLREHKSIGLSPIKSSSFRGFKIPPTTLKMEGGRVNGGEGDQQQQHALSADMMYKLSKKIAQLTKVSTTVTIKV